MPQVGTMLKKSGEAHQGVNKLHVVVSGYQVINIENSEQ